MSDEHSRIRVIGLHRLPFDEQAFEEEVRLEDQPPDWRAELREQYRENWDNAWLVVVEFDGQAEDLDFVAIWHDSGPSGQQAPWLDEVLEAGPTTTRAAFYLHYMNPKEPLRYKDEAVPFPAESAPDADLLRRMPYCSPD